MRFAERSSKPFDEFLTMVKKWILRLFGHVSRSSSLARTIPRGTVIVKRRKGRQKKSWEHRIKRKTGMTFARSTRASENRTRRRKTVVVKSSVVP